MWHIRHIIWIGIPNRIHPRNIRHQPLRRIRLQPATQQLHARITPDKTGLLRRETRQKRRPLRRWPLGKLYPEPIMVRHGRQTRVLSPIRPLTESNNGLDSPVIHLDVRNAEVLLPPGKLFLELCLRGGRIRAVDKRDDVGVERDHLPDGTGRVG